jgi:N-acetylglucosamine-6-phosphate deacetylase
MDGAFRMLLTSAGRSLPDAVLMCATTPARALGLGTHGIIAPGAAADLVVLDDTMHVVHTVVGGHVVYSRPGARPNRGDTL